MIPWSPWPRWTNGGAPGISRRAFLGGAAATVLLPWLPSLTPRGARADSTAPVRLVFWYVPNGMHMDAWTPTTDGDAFELPPILAPLSPVRDQVLVVSGLANLPALGVDFGDHARGTAAFLSCTAIDRAGIRAGISADQVAASSIGQHTRFPSLQVGIDPTQNTGACDTGYSCAYTHNISWAGPTTPLPKINNPRALFDRLFAGGDAGLTAEDRERRRQSRSSLLDHTTQDAAALAARLDAVDRARLDEYLTGVRELEQRLQHPEVASCGAPPVPGAFPDVELHIDVMAELMATALRCDMTRIISFMTGIGGSSRDHSFIGVPGAHHDISHHGWRPENHEKLILINTWEVERLRVFLTSLAAIPDGDGSLLDHTAVMFSSDVSDGNLHNHDNLPFLLAGGAGGHLKPGRHLRYDEAPVADVLIHLLGAAGVPVEALGDDGTGPLPGLAG